MKRNILRSGGRALTVAGLIVGLLAVGGSPRAEARPIRPQPTVDLLSVARLGVDRQSVDVDVTASCPARWTVVEAVVTVIQPQASGSASFPLTCTGGNQLFTVTIQSGGAPFQLGQAQGTASVVIERGRRLQAQDTQLVRFVPTVSVALADVALLSGGGQVVTIEVTVACPVGSTGEQSYVNVQQGQASGFGFYVPSCDGQPHTFTVAVQASQGLYQVGGAHSTAFAFVGAGGDVFFGDTTHPIQIVAN
jgi:hypothetical protein